MGRRGLKKIKQSEILQLSTEWGEGVEMMEHSKMNHLSSTIFKVLEKLLDFLPLLYFKRRIIVLYYLISKHSLDFLLKTQTFSPTSQQYPLTYGLAIMAV